MPRPGYIICSVSGSLDSYINTMSAFNIIESIEIEEARPQPGQVIKAHDFRMRVITAWFKEDTDSVKQLFEAEIVALAPKTDQEVFTARFPSFRFSAPLHRLILPDFSFPTVPLASGFLRLECRVRKVGETGWTWRQQYPIAVVNKVPTTSS
jgi:hypothetical protein